MAESNADEMLQALDAAIGTVARADEPYWPATELAGLASSLMTEFGVAYRLWCIWTALTDRYELKPEERPEALAAMDRAAGEWMTIATGDAAREEYLERWMFDELGLDRKIGREF